MEIGPSYMPICSKREGYNIRIIDVATKDELIRKYENDNIVSGFINNIEEVDYVWNGEKYSDLIGEKFDYILGANIIEHQIDLIDFFANLESVLNDDGIISLGIPDKRFSFDIFREVTSIRTVLDVHQMNLKVHPIGVQVDYMLHNAFYSGTGHQIPYDFYYNQKNVLFEKDFNAIRHFIQKYDNRTFIDQHAWIFTPSSLRLLIKELYALELTNLVEVDFCTVPDSMEFYLKLKKDNTKSRTIDRKEYIDLLMHRQNEEFEILHFPWKMKMMCDQCNGRIYVYGAGTIAHYVLYIAELYDINIECVVISDDKDIPKLNSDIAIRHLGEVVDYTNEDIFIIATTYIHQSEIKESLKNIGIQKYITISEISEMINNDITKVYNNSQC